MEEFGGGTVAGLNQQTPTAPSLSLARTATSLLHFSPPQEQKQTLSPSSGIQIQTVIDGGGGGGWGDKGKEEVAEWGELKRAIA